MPLLPKTQISWSEPYFFVIRLRERKGWILRGLGALFIALLMFAAIYFTRPQFELWSAVGISLAAGVVLMLAADLPNFQREVTIREDSILYVGTAGTISTGSFEFKEIRSVDLMRPEDWSKPHGAMLLHLGDEGFLLGVPNKVKLTTIADILHRLGVEVHLEGWEPSETDTRVQVREEVVLLKEAASGDARIWPVEEQDGKLCPTSAQVVGAVIALGPLFVALVGLIAAGIYLFMQWGELSIVGRILVGGGAFAAVIAGFLYLVVVGQSLAGRFGISVGKKSLRMRPNALFGVDDENLVPVEVFDRKAWTSTFSQSVDFGFLQIDPNQRVLRFEGNRNRWDIPAGALTTCRIEEAKVGSESEDSERRYYVVISVDRDGEAWEAGLLPTRTEFGGDGSETRHERARGLFEELSGAVSDG